MRLFFFAALCLCLFLVACQSEPKQDSANYVELRGRTMGTSYSVTYEDPLKRNFSSAIDSVLDILNKEVNTYDPNSVISEFNKQEKELFLGLKSNANQHFITNFNKAKEAFEYSEGALDPTVMPLVNYWGFGYTSKEAVTLVDSIKVDSLKAFVGLSKTMIVERNDSMFVQKQVPGIMLDFSAIAKGYGVDLVGKLLASKGLKNYLVEIGGEVVSEGVNSRGEAWNIAVSDPRKGATLSDYVAILPIQGKGMATSGNYRNFYETENGTYGHTINPGTGFPETHTLISASIVAPDCATADALATACMVKGPNGAFEMIKNLDNIEGFFVFRNDEGSLSFEYTKGLEPYFK